MKQCYICLENTDNIKICKKKCHNYVHAICIKNINKCLICNDIFEDNIFDDIYNFDFTIKLINDVNILVSFNKLLKKTINSKNNLYLLIFAFLTILLFFVLIIILIINVIINILCIIKKKLNIFI